MNEEERQGLIRHMERTTSLFETLIEVVGEITRAMHDQELSISVAAKLHAFAAQEEIGEYLEGESYLREDHDHGEADDGATA